MMLYQRFKSNTTVPDAIVVKLYSSGGTVRGYVRKIADRGQDDTIFPGEEMTPEAALKLAASHSDGVAPIYVELLEDVEWDPRWGELAG
ncbi:hypothetical protein WMC41_29740 (plasmid) [Shinella yambaruensis]|uniref:hypothetical protein n=1 Tax=Shinella yambaruensis TaxID=415996 RepID=UPI003D7AC599